MPMNIELLVSMTNEELSRALDRLEASQRALKDDIRALRAERERRAQMRLNIEHE